MRVAETELEIGNNKYSESILTRFSIPIGSKLRHMTIGDNSLQKVVAIELKGLGELESVVIGNNSFTYTKTDNDIMNSKRTDGACRIVNCPKLKSIQIGDRSFSDYHSFELNNLPSLQSIDIDGWCFHDAPSFSLTGMID